MPRILEDLSTLAPKKLTRRLEDFAADGLPCLGIHVYDGDPQDGLTTGLSIASRGRSDVRDLARVADSEPGGYASVAWATLSPSRLAPYWRLLLRVSVERPVRCAFDVRFDVRDESADPMRIGLPLLLAADRFALSVDGPVGGTHDVAWIPAPSGREAVVKVLTR